MGELEPMIKDLALILIFAGAMTLIFKKLGQPLVLGYIVAGFLAGPHFGLLPSVVDTVNVHLWSDIGVIFLLFALGLEFSFKKILKVGGTAVVAALVIIVGMIFLGFTLGTAFGWQKMDALFLGGMIAMSSTTIIYKAFDDLGLRKKQFTGLVLSILILEDILAVVLMVLLSTIAVSNSVNGFELVQSIAKLAFFLILWFVVGLYIIPIFLKWARKLLTGETLLVVALGLCFGMVVFAAAMGFSAAFGAFIMGSILAETIEAERIDKLVNPVKDLFGAIFFVSVGMMVDPAMIAQYALPIILITLTVIVGQATFATLGVLLSGQPLKTAVQCGFSLTQIGEFAFIIAALGQSLKVTSDFLYPIVVAVSVITIFLTPYMIRLAEPFYGLLSKRLPKKWLDLANRVADRGSSSAAQDDSSWRKYLRSTVTTVLIYGIVAFAITALAFLWFVPLMDSILPGTVGKALSALGILIVLGPFIYTISLRHTFSDDFKKLWGENRNYMPLLVAIVIVRFLIAMGFVFYVLYSLFHLRGIPIFLLAFAAVIFILSSRLIRRQSLRIESNFKDNLRARDVQAEYLGQKQPEYASRLISKDLHFADFTVPGDSEWAGKTLAELNLGRRFSIHVASILRGNVRINVPEAHEHVFPQDVLQVIGTDTDMEVFSRELKSSGRALDEDVAARSEMVLRQVIIHENSPFNGKTIKECGIRKDYHCLIAGVETKDGKLYQPAVDIPFVVGDVVWVVGQKADVGLLLQV
ncbi:MAG: cation:proton antiporter [Bacteroidales bacterium]|nr:cation:proton antiporter [Bacteroidales bacterium]